MKLFSVMSDQRKVASNEFIKKTMCCPYFHIVNEIMNVGKGRPVGQAEIDA